MLANRISDAFRFYLAGMAVNAVLFLRRGVQIYVVQLRMGDFVNGGLYRL